MSAPTLNAALPPTTGPAAAIGATASPTQGAGPLAGFEALLAAFFGAQGEVAVAGQAGKALGKPAGVAGASSVEDLTAQEAAPTAAASDDPATALDAVANAAACNAALMMPVAPQPIADASATTETVAAPAPAVAAGQPFAPVFQQAATNEPSNAGPNVPKTPDDAETAAPSKLDPTIATALSAPAPAPAPAKSTSPQAASATPPAPAPAAVPAPTPAAAPPERLPDAPVPAAPVVTSEAATAAPSTLVAGPAGQPTPAPSTAPKDKGPAARFGRAEHARIDIAAAGAAKPAAAAAAITDAAAPSTEGDDAVHAPEAGPPGSSAKAEAPEAPSGSADTGAATASTTTAATQVHPGAIPVRGAPQTVAALAAQIAKKLDGRSTRFDVQLDPAGLGRVDVRMEIGASGRMTAAMTFDTPQAAAELRARAAELQRHLEQAGFDMSGGLSFDVAGDNGQGRQAQHNQDNNSGSAFRGRAFQEALATAGQADHSAAGGALNLRRSLLSGVDIRI